MTHGFFITGTDTGVGKTLAACALLHAFARNGRRVVGMKPVAAGATHDDSGLVNDDVVRLRAAANTQAPPELTNPYCFEAAIAPHLAATHAGAEISMDVIAGAFMALTERADVVVVEGVGGFCVPLNETQDSADLAVRLGLPVILVVGIRLGCLNHAVLTARAIEQRNLVFAGWIANRIDPQMMEADLNIMTLKRRLKSPLLGDIEYATLPDAVRAAARLDLSVLR